jgi:hypothetical protein
MINLHHLLERVREELHPVIAPLLTPFVLGAKKRNYWWLELTRLRHGFEIQAEIFGFRIFATHLERGLLLE